MHANLNLSVDLVRPVGVDDLKALRGYCWFYLLDPHAGGAACGAMLILSPVVTGNTLQTYGTQDKGQKLQEKTRARALRLIQSSNLLTVSIWPNSPPVEGGAPGFLYRRFDGDLTPFSDAELTDVAIEDVLKSEHFQGPNGRLLLDCACDLLVQAALRNQWPAWVEWATIHRAHLLPNVGPATTAFEAPPIPTPIVHATPTDPADPADPAADLLVQAALHNAAHGYPSGPTS